MYRLIVITFTLTALGCGSDPLSVEGEVVSVVDGAPGGFEFEPRTRLAESVDDEDVDVAGRCRIGPAEVFVSVERDPASDAEAAVRSFAMRMNYDDAGERLALHERHRLRRGELQHRRADPRPRVAE